ncbi:MAG: YdcF family protein [Gammaproteobacteria bacterium]|nr:YdcF family protein [Gammaproteobacteria bacterium]
MAEFDAIVVLGAKLAADGSSTPALRRRARHAAALLNSGVASALVLSGGQPVNGVSEAEQMFQVALGQSADPRRMLLEARSRNTWENAKFTAELLRRHGWSRVLLVSDAWHLPRAQIAFRAHGIVVRPSAPRSFERGLRDQARSIGYETLALPWYLLRVMFSRPPGRSRSHPAKGSE